tara:strand:+ start:397 stop:636 length:240 start_codon:yes stop_codon:yes gene_type:complete
MFERAGKKNENNTNWQLWQQDNHPIELWDNYMIDNKLTYLHQNPVVAGVVKNAEDYIYSSSSAADYAEQKGKIDVELLQ